MSYAKLNLLKERLESRKLAYFWKKSDRGIFAEFTEIPGEIKEVMEMGTDGDDEKEARKLASLLEKDMD